ncbi:MAG TPA: DUF2171 domain-containing protein [Ktedonobacteraceae bacterium]
MAQWNQNHVRPHMRVYSSNGEHVGHIAAVYEDSFLIHKGYFFPTDRYIPYSMVSGVEENQIRLALSTTQLEESLWQKRPDYEHHLGDPTQLFYDEGHGVPDPYQRDYDPYDDTGFERHAP